MSDETQPTEETKAALTPEEIKAMRDKMEAHWDEQLPFLKKQAEYEILIADIEEARTRRLEMSLRYAQMAAAAQGKSEEEPKRKLKTEE